MDMMCDMMGDKEIKTKNDVKEMIEDIATELNIRKYHMSLKVKQFNQVMKWIYEMGISTIHPLNFYPQLQVWNTILYTKDNITFDILYHLLWNMFFRKVLRNITYKDMDIAKKYCSKCQRDVKIDSFGGGF